MLEIAIEDGNLPVITPFPSSLIHEMREPCISHNAHLVNSLVIPFVRVRFNGPDSLPYSLQPLVFGFLVLTCALLLGAMAFFLQEQVRGEERRR